MSRGFIIAALALTVAACGEGGGSPPEARNVQESAEAAPAKAKAKGATMPKCPFRQTSWVGSIEGGRLLVNGTVDLQMAGMKPQLTERPSSPPVLGFDLALVAAAGEPVSNTIRYEKSGSRTFRRAEVHCGGEKLTEFDLIVVE